MTTCLGLPGPVITLHLSRKGSRARYEPGAEFHIGRIEMAAKSGTCLDMPFLRLSGRYDLARLLSPHQHDSGLLAIRPGRIRRCRQPQA
jgi:hypothetical protein